MQIGLFLGLGAIRSSGPSEPAAPVIASVTISPDGTGFVVTGDPGDATHVQVELAVDGGAATAYDIALAGLTSTPALVAATADGSLLAGTSGDNIALDWVPGIGVEVGAGVTATVVSDGAGGYDIEITSPTEQAGSYNVSAADLVAAAGKPILVAAPALDASEADWTVHPGIYISPSSDPAEFTVGWHRNGVPIAGETSASYAPVSPDDDEKLIEYIEQAGNLSGLSAEQRLTTQEFVFSAATIQIRDSRLLTAADTNSTYVFGPSSEYTTANTLAVKFTPRTSTVNTVIFAQNTSFGVTFIGDATKVRVRVLNTLVDFSILTVVDVPVSLMVSWDAAASFVGGKTVMIYGKIGAAEWAELGSSTAAISVQEPPIDLIGTNTTAVAGSNFDIEHWLWATDEALDPSLNYQTFFNTDGTVKDLGGDGTAGGALPAPRLYVSGAGWAANPITNSGTGKDINVLGNQPVVVS